MELQYKQEQHVRESIVICVTQLEGGLLFKKLNFEVIFF